MEVSLKELSHGCSVHRQEVLNKCYVIMYVTHHNDRLNTRMRTHHANAHSRGRGTIPILSGLNIY